MTKDARLATTCARPATTISRKALHAHVWAQPLAEVAATLGISRTGLAKICDRLEIPCPPRGYWARRRKGLIETPAPLPPAPDAGAETITLGEGRAPSRRPQRRLDSEERRLALLDVAAGLVAREGVHAATLKRIAQEAGVSEGLAQSYFRRQADVLIALARRELEVLREAQDREIALGSRPADRIARSTAAYLRQVERRGALLQLLLGNPAVREGLREERARERADRGGAVAERFSETAGVAPDIARAATTILTSLCLRTGRLLARGRIDLEQAETLSQAMVRHGNRRLAAISDAGALGQGR